MVIVDVYNVLHVTGVLPPDLAGLDPSGLGDLIAISRYGGDEVLLVCDGTRAALARAHPHGDVLPGDGPSGAGLRTAGGGVRTLFAGLTSSADDLIEHELERTPRSKRVVVVSNDHRLRKAAGRAHARTLRSETFLHQLVLDRASFERGVPVGPGGRRPARPAFATDIPLDRASLQRWLAALAPEVAAATEALVPQQGQPRDQQHGHATVQRAVSSKPSLRIAQGTTITGDEHAHKTLSGPERNEKNHPRAVQEAGTGPGTRSGPVNARAGRAEIPADVAAWLLSHGVDPADLNMEKWLKTSTNPGPGTFSVPSSGQRGGATNARRVRSRSGPRRA